MATQHQPLYFEYAVELNRHTYPRIIAYTESFGYHLAQEFDSILKTDGDLGLMVNMVFDVSQGRPESFGVFPAATFDACWHYGDGQRGPFTRIHKTRY